MTCHFRERSVRSTDGLFDAHSIPAHRFMNRKTSPDTNDSAARPEKTERISVSGDLRIGRTIGDFLVESPIGQGGMGTVYRGRQLSLGRPVALKFLRPGPGIDARAVARFESEARLAASLNHPNVVQIYALGACDDLPFIAMELVQGRNLGQILSDRVDAGLGPLPVEECIAAMRQAALGLQAAAELGLVHRDIKPENLMITPKGVVKVADFGLARDLRLQGRSLTETGFTLGTPLYMSPEQVLGRDVDARSDLYSLGMTFWHLLACRPPLTAESPFLLGMKQVNESPGDIRAIRPDCPTEIAELLGRLIAKRPEDRPADVSEALEVLNRHDTGRPPAELVAAAEAGAAATARSTIATLPFDTAGYQTGTRTLRLPVGPIVARRFWLRWFGVAAAGFAGAFLFGRLSRRRARRTAGAAAQAWPPSLGLADWARIERRDTAERQYRFAQIRADEADRIAAWLAVPGYFPNDSDWAWRAYVQLAGELVRGGDRLRLMRLKAGLEECGKGIAFANLAEIVQAALDGMDGAEISMLETLNEHVKDAMDLALAELILTILTHYRQRVGADAIVPTRLTRLQMAVQEVLRIESP